MTQPKETAIEQFQEMADLDRRVAGTVSKVMAQSPVAVMIAWEEADGSIKATSIPFSACLVKGMVDSLYDMVFSDKESEDEPDESED
jgi:hypothetical protein